ncbi:MAG: hypothetical protein FJ275_12525, partial [Planctomycetes bacterium]|nr:hypothetical protein [Planctomycetota bacterium]
MGDRDDHADDVLRRVPLPDLLRAGVSFESLFDDAAIDRILCRIDLPTGLAGRVRASSCGEDAGRRTGVLDLDRVAASAVAPGPVSPRRRPPWRGLVRMAQETAQVVAVLSMALLLAMAGIEFSRRLEGAGSVRHAGRVARVTDR